MTQLTDVEKDIIAENFAKNDDGFAWVQSHLYGGWNHYLDKWIEKSKEARLQRWEKSKKYIFNQIFEAKQVLTEVEERSLVTSYFEGIEGIDQDGVEGIFNYIEATVGTSYDGVSGTNPIQGLKNKNYSPIDGQSTMNDVTVGTMDIIKNGNYLVK